MADWKEALSHYPGYSPDDPRENGATTDADEAAPAPLDERADAGQAQASPAEPAGDPFEVKAQGIYTEPESAWREEPAEVAPRRDLSGDPLALQNQICFPLYAASKELTRRYKPFLDPLGLTYTQYVTMMALWEQDRVSVSALGRQLFLDSATLTPLLKRLESHGYLTRERSRQDERSVIITLTQAGRALRNRAIDVPRCVCDTINLDPEDLAQLKALIDKLLMSFSEE